MTYTIDLIEERDHEGRVRQYIGSTHEYEPIHPQYNDCDDAEDEQQ